MLSCRALTPRAALSNLRLSAEERQYLEKHCPYFHADYLDFVSALSLDPANQVQVTFIPHSESNIEADATNISAGEERDAQRRKTDDGNASKADEMGLIEMDIQGPWRDCILYEVPLMSICKW